MAETYFLGDDERLFKDSLTKLLADWSDAGVQGFNNWSYGFWIKTNASLTYSASRFTAFPSGTGPHSRANFWDGAVWRCISLRLPTSK